MKIEYRPVIRVNKALWTIVDPINFIVERFGRQARLIFKTNSTGRMVTTNIVNGRIRSVPFTTR